PFLVVLVAALAVAESLPVALAVAGLSAVLTASALLRLPGAGWAAALAAALAYAAIVIAIDRALAGEKRRLAATPAALARLKPDNHQLRHGGGRGGGGRRH